MFDTEKPVTRLYADFDAAKEELVDLEQQVAAARARQTEILAWLDAANVARCERARSLEEWTAGNLDIAPATARSLVTAARARGQTTNTDTGEGAGIDWETLGEESVTFDRAVAIVDLVAAGGTPHDVEASFGHDLIGLRRRIAHLKKMTRVDERTLVRKRHLKIEPTLGDTAYKITGIAPGYDGHLIAKALQERADRFPNRIDGENSGRSQRTLDALTALCQDYLDEDHSGQDDLAGTKPNKAAGGSVTVFMEMNQAAATGGELGASLAAGPRVGPDTLERILCGGAVSVVGLDERGRPVTVTNRARRIPPAIRDLVLQRDGGCVIEGCRSRYRLEPHHIHRYSHGGDHDPDNLATLCWAHHHVAIHGYGHRIDPTSPPQRRRLLRPGAPDPPIPIAA